MSSIFRSILDKLGFREKPESKPVGLDFPKFPGVISPLPDEMMRNLTPTPTPAPRLPFKRVTYYLPTGSPTATGTEPRSGYTAAISPDLLGSLKMGDIITLKNGIKVRVEDKTNKRLKNTLDIFYNDKQSAKYPNGMDTDVDFDVTGHDTSDMKYNY